MAHHDETPSPLPNASQHASAYVGTELPLFAKAVHWKSYFGKTLARYVRGDVLEVGAGFGGTTPFLCNRNVRSWTAVEPDAQLAGQLPAFVREAGVHVEPRVHIGMLRELPREQKFDCITYIDVLEHIEHDAAELTLAASHLRSGGHLIVLSPAYPWLFSEFDRAVGHFRRYTTKTLRAVGPACLTPVRFFYLDAAGMAASFANRLVLKQSSPTIEQVTFWDRWIVPLSVVIDPIVRRSFGRSVVGVWNNAEQRE